MPPTATRFAWLPHWLRHYQRAWLGGDVSAGLIVAVLVIPQSLAYTLLAGLPAEMGLYASILPVVAYALVGSSMTLAVGPVAIAALMTASALQPLAIAGTTEYVQLAMHLALISGLMFLAFGALRLGFLAYFLSRPVISGFVSGSAVMIALGQLKHILGVEAPSSSSAATLQGLWRALPQSNPTAIALGLGSMVALLLARRILAPALLRVGVGAQAADLLARMAPIATVIVGTGLVAWGQWDVTRQVAVVGSVPAGLPAWNLSLPGLSELGQLWLPALLISLVGFVGSVSVAQSFAMQRQQRIAPDRELWGMGAANIASALTGSYPVHGGLSRSAINFAAGAQTPLASLITAAFMVVIISLFTPLFYYLPLAVLAAGIIVAVFSLVDMATLQASWAYDRADALSLLATAVGVIVLGVETGIVLGVAMSLAALVWRSSHPHMAVVGRVPGTEHFRNVERHAVETVPGLLALRVDESLFFANATALEEHIETLMQADASIRRLLLVCSAVNQIDATALGMLTELEQSLSQRGIRLELAEVKGPVMDRLQPTTLGQRLQGRLFRSVHDAFVATDRQTDPHWQSP
ncbi:sulfate permease [Rhodoferax saidenbachensis]|uniref:SulP family sulfate permease n=1 Tax=Rhodoferax saidenbachensis TaxID=1484693 RepID=A0ABU1ZPH8_9BURK|nr:sulfate permease [Rhodoferax saidenbachensis]MDR7307438.1 SulP family sulfate permease [Rhodoferax saidenbachensis]